MSSLNLLETPLARKIILLLRYLAAEHDAPYGGDQMLFEILHFDSFRIAPTEIAKLSVEVAGKQFGEQRTSIRRLLYEKTGQPARDLFDSGLPEELKRASRVMEKLIGDIPDITLEALFENCIRDTGILATILQSPDKTWLEQVLTALSDFVKEETLRNPEMDLQNLVERIGLMKSSGILIPLPDFGMPPFGEAIAPEIEPAQEYLISRMLEKFVMNVTALNNYLRCPLEFYYKNIIRIPSPRNEAMEFGSSVHFALQRLFEKMKANAGEKFPAAEELLQDFQWHMHRHRESFNRKTFSRRIEYGLGVLSNYYDAHIHQWNKIVAVERNIRHVMVKGIPIRGKLDKLEFNGKEVKVVDYKTGDVEKAKDKLAPPDHQQPDGGDYWRQAVFYKILIDNYEQKDWKVSSTEFDFVEPDKKKQYHKIKILIRPEDSTTVTQQIADTWWKIQNRKFYTGCGKPECHWCDFVKTNNLAIALHEIAGEDI